LIRLPLDEFPSPILKKESYFGFDPTQVHGIDSETQMVVGTLTKGAKRFEVKLGEKF
jgi:hypothetical protein